MCHASCLDFGKKHLTEDICKGKRVLEAGAKNINGSLRQHIESLKPLSYIGTDIEIGPGVDHLCSALSLSTLYPENSFDLVVCTETLEHIYNWASAIDNLKYVCKATGHILLTTRSPGFPKHGYPTDFWRFTKQDMTYIFSNFIDVTIENDPQRPGVFVFACKPIICKHIPLDSIKIAQV